MPDEQAVSGHVFIATGENGLRLLSKDGINWTHQATDREGVLLRHACFINGRCVTAGRYGGDQLAWTTSDGLTWDKIKLDGRPYVTRVDFLFAESDHITAVVGEDGETPGAMTSTDGKTWSPRVPITADRKGMKHDAHLRRIASGNGRLVVIGDYGARLVRPADARLFQIDQKASATDTLIDIAFGNGVFVGAGLHGLRMRSEDGFQWTDRVLGEEGEHINAMIFDGKQFVGIGQGATYISPDGKDWTRTPNENAPTSAVFGGGVYVGSLWPGKLLKSTDGIAWSQVHESPHHVLGFAYGRLAIDAAHGTLGTK